jgi:hypothetical protein
MKNYTTRKFIGVMSVVFAGLSLGILQSSEEKRKYKKIKARITYYTSDKKYGIRVADPKTKYAIEGITAAAHTNFKFGSVISIPHLKGKIGNGNFIVQDRGSAVNSKKAARGRGYVFDVYVKNHTKLKQMAETMPMWMDVIVYE